MASRLVTRDQFQHHPRRASRTSRRMPGLRHIRVNRFRESCTSDGWAVSLQMEKTTGRKMSKADAGTLERLRPEER
jgi:hypothetical protein